MSILVAKQSATTTPSEMIGATIAVIAVIALLAYAAVRARR
ncbi:MAG: hypothetical protein QOH28_1896 [Actinomycetota bacterium]|jgi:hypothetical protein|nr:hypothetical protein [Actinomycetota bacterium]